MRSSLAFAGLTFATWATCAAGLAGCATTEIIDAPAAELELQPAFLDLDAAPPDGKLPVLVQVFHDGSFVELSDAHTLHCNGVRLIFNGLGYAERIDAVAAGGSFTISHTTGDVTTEASVTVPPRPVITAPDHNELVLRNTAFEIDYVDGTSAGVRATASDAVTAVASIEQPDTGLVLIDVSPLQFGPGTVDVTRRIETSSAGTGFAGFVATYNVSSIPVAVTWQ